MTLENYEKAQNIVKKIRSLDTAIAELQYIMSSDTSKWILEIRANKSCSLNEINHYGILPEVLKEILSIHLAEREKLIDELGKL